MFITATTAEVIAKVRNLALTFVTRRSSEGESAQVRGLSDISSWSGIRHWRSGRGAYKVEHEDHRVDLRPNRHLFSLLGV